MRHAEVTGFAALPEHPADAVPSARPAGDQPSVATGLNLSLMCIVLGGTVFQLYGMPFVLRALGGRAVWLLLPIMLLQPLHWGLLHEGIHARLFPSRDANEFWARVLSIMLGLPFDGTRLGHLVHHRFPRHGYDRPDVYDGRGPYALSWIGYRVRLFGGVYLTELVSPLLACVPTSFGVRVMERAIPITEQGDAQIRRLYFSLVRNIRKRRRTRRAFAMTLALYGASAWVYGAWWPVLLATMYARGLWHSFADNVPHHAIALDKPARARNYRVPPGVRLLVMNHHLHLTHHLHPTVPWTSLGAVSLGEGERPNRSYFRAALAQARPMFPARE